MFLNPATAGRTSQASPIQAKKTVPAPTSEDATSTNSSTASKVEPSSDRARPRFSPPNVRSSWRILVVKCPRKTYLAPRPGSRRPVYGQGPVHHAPRPSGRTRCPSPERQPCPKARTRDPGPTSSPLPPLSSSIVYFISRQDGFSRHWPRTREEGLWVIDPGLLGRRCRI